MADEVVEAGRDEPGQGAADPAVDRAALRAPAVPLEPFSIAYRGRTAFRSAHEPPISRRYLPLIASLHGYDRNRLRTDAVAGVTVAALALPASMAYADIAGLPVTSGLYSLLLPLVVYAVLGSVPWLVVGPESTLALLVAAGLGPLAVAGSPEYTSLAAALALLVGGVYLAARLLRLGWIADYFSQAVLVGYITGVAALILLGQLGKLVGMSSDQDNKVVASVDIVAHLGRAHGPTVALAACSLVLLVGLRHFVPRFPAALLVVVLGILTSWVLDLAEHGVSTAGEVPAGLPDLVIPDLGGNDLLTLVGVAGGIFLVGFSDSILTARSFAAQRGERIDADQELLAFSAANAAAGVTQGMPMGTTGSRTAVNLSMGSTSQVTGLVASASILVVLVFLTDPIQYLPDATLAAIIVTGAVRLLDPDQWRSLARSSRTEVAIAALTVLAVVNVGVLEALVAAVVLSLLDVIRRVARPNDAVLGWSTTERRYADVDHDPAAAVTPGVVVYRFSDRLFFANVHFFKRRVWAAVDAAPGPVRHVVLDMAGVPGIDASAATGLRELHHGLAERDVGLEIARATDPLETSMDRLGLVELIGTDHVHGTVTAAVEAVARPSAPG
jgi:high affinity sulfate transporter 1